jgi:hypothetical protein
LIVAGTTIASFSALVRPVAGLLMVRPGSFVVALLWELVYEEEGDSNSSWNNNPKKLRSIGRVGMRINPNLTHVNGNL